VTRATSFGVTTASGVGRKSDRLALTVAHGPGTRASAVSARAEGRGKHVIPQWVQAEFWNVAEIGGIPNGALRSVLACTGAGHEPAVTVWSTGSRGAACVVVEHQGARYVRGFPVAHAMAIYDAIRAGVTPGTARGRGAVMLDMSTIRHQATEAARHMATWHKAAERPGAKDEAKAGAVAARQYWRGSLFAWLVMAFGTPADHQEVNALIERALTESEIIGECFDGGPRRPRWVAERLAAQTSV
jgi:hypothetical protein